MGSLIQRTTTLTGLTAAGVYRYTSGPLPRLLGRNRAAVAIVCDAPWGPTNTLWSPDNESEIYARHWPAASQAVKDWAGLRWGKRYFVRVEGGSAAAATVTFPTAAAASSLVATARYKGAFGNNIKVTVTANVAVSSSRDVRVRVLRDGVAIHDETYLAVQVSNGTVTDPGDPYVTFTKYSGASAQAAAAAETSLAFGSDGTITDAEVVTALELCGGDGNDIGIICFAGLEAIADDVSVAVGTFAADADKGRGKLVICPTATAKSAATIITDSADYGNGDNVVVCWPRLRRYVRYNYLGATASGVFDCDAGVAMASMVQNCDPWEEPMLSVVSDKRLVDSIKGVETAYANTGNTTYGDLQAAGICAWMTDDTFGTVPRASVTLDVTTQITVKNWRYAEYIGNSIAPFLARYIGKPLDIDLADETYGPNTRAIKAGVEGFLDIEYRAGRLVDGLNDDGSDSPAYLFDGFGLATAPNVAAGRWDIAVQARITPTLLILVMHEGLSTTVNIVREAA